ncbi:Wrnip1 [Symbiodinium necroappetens]|uniref:Wrnip1 protein n=1 Tax=Symbiodinium necroappetens TaxID=1628268 RepID=A0A813BHW9_9DINO|nr:Wrnip1 [Symbiodinium necroappetens]
MRDMADGNADSELAALRDVLGHTLDDAELKKLLNRAGNNAGVALNLHYDQATAATGGNLAQKRPAPSLPGFFETRQKYPKTDNSIAIDEKDANSERKHASAIGSLQEKPATAACASSATTPLAERMRPKGIQELLGQEDALGSVLRQAVREDHLPSLILWGPPGCGKTSFAHCVAAGTKRAFRSLSAAKAGVAELREELNRAAGTLKLRKLGTILFVDEFHRWSKAQQDALLLDCEKGIITLIAATTENPSFSINNAILSRCRLVVFGKLSPEAVGHVIDRAIREDVVLGGTTLTGDARQLLATAADGDARVALNSLELAAHLTKSGLPIDSEAVQAAIQKRALYDRNGDFHYDLISALHKSMRGGCPDASLYYATRMLTAGEEPRYITRRLIRFASEDVGMADPLALSQAVAADQAVHAIGMPEAGVVIAQCVIYLALAPKSCAVYNAYETVKKLCEREPHAPVPLHIRNAPTKVMKTLGYGDGYVYNPAAGYTRGCNQGYLPEAIGDKQFFNKSDCVANRLNLPPFRWVQYRPEPEEMLSPLTVHGMELNLLGAVAGVCIGQMAVELRQVLHSIASAAVALLPASCHASTMMDRTAPLAAMCFHMSSCAVMSPFVVAGLEGLLKEAQLHRHMLLPTVASSFRQRCRWLLKRLAAGSLHDTVRKEQDVEFAWLAEDGKDVDDHVPHDLLNQPKAYEAQAIATCQHQSTNIQPSCCQMAAAQDVPHPERGGFHVAWPPDGDMEALGSFTARAVDALAQEGYCVIQLPLSEEAAEEAQVEVTCGRYRWKRLRREFEPSYLGRHQKCKTAWLEEMVEEKQEMDSPIDLLDLYLARFTQFLLPVAPFALDFMPHSRTSGMLRVPASSEGAGVSENISDEDIAKGLVDEHVDFLKRRKLCMFLMAHGSGGELSLYPKDGAQIVLPAQAGRLVVFRHDRISYAYRPDSEEDLVLQAWVLTAPAQFQFGEVAGDQKSKDELYGLVSGPNTPEGRRICVYGVGISLPGAAFEKLDAYWCAVAGGTDGYVYAPVDRFDIEPYTRTGEEWQIGYTYTVHGGFCKDIFSFDNDFFNVPEEEAWLLAPAARQLLERSYEALFNTGMRKKDIRGKRVGVYIGHSGDDFSIDPRFTMGSTDGHRFGYQARKWSCIAGRISYTLGLQGPQALLDTACSSALVAYGVGHTALRQVTAEQTRAGQDSGITEALMGGANLIPGPGNYINLCGPHMLSISGRCFTFDMSADGFERGEGSSCFFARSEEAVTREAIATVIGACLNQDGRSASMTAPNGPSQQECVRGSMREAGLTANQITCSELHGTGTALGDPIEVGALRGVMQDRKAPIMQTSAKSHIGHLEANAGQAGIIKCILMCNSCAGSPNCHLYILNPHLDVNGYPTVFNTELTEYGNQSGYSGVSSFGFGGANARADVYAVASRGPRKPGKVSLDKVDYVVVSCPFDEGPMHYVDGKEVPTSGSRISRNRGRYRCDNIRDEFDQYDYNSSLYDGKFQMSPPEEMTGDRPDSGIGIVGSWDSFKQRTEMTPSSDGDSWSCMVVVGETRVERFQLCLMQNPDMAIYPYVKNGSMTTRVVGPHGEGKGKFWIIDGRDDEVPAGTPFRITLEWGLRLRVSWQRADAMLTGGSVPKLIGSKARHRYFVVGSWTSWNFLEMQNSGVKEGAFEVTVRIGMSRSESFYFVRDQDEEQVIYPAKPALDAGATAIPVRGPDAFGNGKCWRITGKHGESVRLRIEIVDALIKVSVSSLIRPDSGWTASGVTGPARHSYWVLGSFNNWSPEQMLPGDRPDSSIIAD